MALDFLSENQFIAPAEALPWSTLPLPNDPCAEYWTTLLSQPLSGSPAELLAEQFIQLRFPVAAGVSETPSYQAATKRGILPQDILPNPPAFTGKLTVTMHPTPAGAIPVIEAEQPEDFAQLLRMLAYKNEPKELPASMGASFLSGVINWRRVGLLQEQGLTIADFKDQPQRFKDNLLLLSSNGYSGVSAQAAGESETAWKRHSLEIRRGHETSHYMTRRFYSSAKNAVHDEIIADCMGLCEAYGRYRPELFLLFMGLEDFPRYRKGGRLENYLSGMTLSPSEFELLCQTVRDAAFYINRYFPSSSPLSPEERYQLFGVLCRTTVSGMASGQFFEG